MPAFFAGVVFASVLISLLPEGCSAAKLSERWVHLVPNEAVPVWFFRRDEAALSLEEVLQEVAELIGESEVRDVRNVRVELDQCTLAWTIEYAEPCQPGHPIESTTVAIDLPGVEFLERVTNVSTVWIHVIGGDVLQPNNRTRFGSSIQPDDLPSALNDLPIPLSSAVTRLSTFCEADEAVLSSIGHSLFIGLADEKAERFEDLVRGLARDCETS